MRFDTIAIAALLVCAVGGCDRHTTRTVTEADVIGTWRMTPQSLAIFSRDGYQAAASETYTIKFAADHSLEFSSILTGSRSGKYISRSGKWTLKHDVSIDNETKRANCLAVEWTRFENMSFAEKQGRLVLWTYYTDPDMGEYIDYVRE